MRTSQSTQAKTFRIDKHILETLIREAENEKESLSFLVNRILASYVDYWRIAKQLNSVTISRGTFSLIIDAVDEDHLKQIGEKAGRNLPRAFISASEGKFSEDTLIDLIPKFSKYSDTWKSSITTSQGTRTITMTHDLGLKWSNYISSFFQAAFNEAHVKVKSVILDRGVVLTLSK